MLDEKEGARTEYQLNTGATCNIMTCADLCNIKQHGILLLECSAAKLKLFDGTIMTVLGEYTLQYTHKGEQCRFNIKIIPVDQKPLL